MMQKKIQTAFLNVRLFLDDGLCVCKRTLIFLYFVVVAKFVSTNYQLHGFFFVPLKIRFTNSKINELLVGK